MYPGDSCYSEGTYKGRAGLVFTDTQGSCGLRPVATKHSCVSDLEEPATILESHLPPKYAGGRRGQLARERALRGNANGRVGVGRSRRFALRP